MAAEQPPEMKYGAKINRIRAENGFSGGSVITKMQDDGTGNKYGPYAWLVAPPSAGRKWYHLGPVNGDDSESGVEDVTQDDGTEEQSKILSEEEINTLRDEIEREGVDVQFDGQELQDFIADSNIINITFEQNSFTPDEITGEVEIDGLSEKERYEDVYEFKMHYSGSRFDGWNISLKNKDSLNHRSAKTGVAISGDGTPDSKTWDEITKELLEN